MKHLVVIPFLFFVSSIFSQNVNCELPDSNCVLDSLSKLYGIEIFVVVSYYTEDSVYTKLQIERRSYNFPKGKWIYLKPRKIDKINE